MQDLSDYELLAIVNVNSLLNILRISYASTAEVIPFTIYGFTIFHLDVVHPVFDVFQESLDLGSIFSASL